MAATDRMYYSRDAEMRAQQERTLTSIVFVMIGMGVGAAVALILASRSRQRSRSGLVGAIEDRFNGFEKDLGELAKRVDHRIREMR